MAVQPGVLAVELLIHLLPQGIVKCRGLVQPHRDFVCLTRVADIDAETGADGVVSEAGLAQLTLRPDCAVPRIAA